MYKKFFCILALCAAVLIGCMACGEDPQNTSEPTHTTPVETTLDVNSGVVDMPTEFMPPVEDTTDPSEAPTEPASTEPTVSDPTDPDPTQPTVAPTEPTEAPTQPTVTPTLPNKPAEQVTFEEFMAMDPYAQTDFIQTFEAADFHAWFQNALAEYKKTHPDFEYNGGAIELPT